VLLLLACTSTTVDTAPAPQATDTDTTADTDPTQDTAPPPDPWCTEPGEPGFQDVAEAWGLADTTDEDPDRKEAGAVALVDLDDDGLDDLVLAHRSRGLLVQHNLGGSFSDEVVLDGDAQSLSGLAIGDVDGDRDLDLWAGGYSPPMRLFLNDGQGGFTDASTSSGMDSFPVAPQKLDAVFGDFDGDGDLDLFVNHDGGGTNPGEEKLDKLLQNDGTGVFTDVSDWLPGRTGVGWSSVWTDLDLDGDVDLYTANADQATHEPSRLSRNDGADGDGWRFTDLSGTCACTNNHNPMGVSAGDYDADGLQDLFLTNTGANQLLWNQGDGTFVDVTAAVGGLALESDDHMSFGAAWFDHENDGTLDLFFSSGPLSGGAPEAGLAEQADQLLVWEEGRLVDAAPSLGLDDRSAGRGVAAGRLDDDGFLDLVVSNLGSPSRLYRAQCTEARALVVDLVGSGANTWGIGARVVVHTDSGTFTREVTAKPGWGGAVTPRAHIGLGDRRVERVTVHWPDGAEQVVDVHPLVDGRVVVHQP